MNINDVKHSALETLTGQTGQIQDLEKAWLLSEAPSAVDGHINDLWLEIFLDNGAISAQYNDSAAQFLFILGFTARDLNQRWFDYWVAGGGIVPVVGGEELRDRDGNILRDRFGNALFTRGMLFVFGRMTVLLICSIDLLVIGLSASVF